MWLTLCHQQELIYVISYVYTCYFSPTSLVKLNIHSLEFGRVIITYVVYNIIMVYLNCYKNV